MFCYSISKFISNHTNVGFDFEISMGVSDVFIMKTICSKSLTCVCFLCNSGIKSRFCIQDKAGTIRGYVLKLCP